jgi:hypothetical protein
MKAMKKFVYLMICGIALTVSCKKQDESLNKEELKTNKEGIVLEKLKSYGIPEKMIVEKGEYYIVDGDIAFHKTKTDLQALDAYFGKPKQDDGVAVLGRAGEISQAHTNNLITNDADAISLKVIRFDLSTIGVPYSWYYATLDAAGHWNAISGTKINIADYNYPGAGNAEITIQNDVNEPIPGYYAMAEFPENGNPGWRVRINHLYDQQLTHATKVYIMVHEIGHCLGLRHTNWQAEGQAGVGANHIPGTPTSDPNSVMNSSGVIDWAGFSSYDIIAAQYLYPWSNAMDKWITVPDSKYPNNVVNMVDDDQTLNVSWNTSLHSTSSVTIRLYQHGVLKGTLGAGLTNSGFASFSRYQVLEALGYPNEYTQGNIRIELVSDSNPAVKDLTGYYVFRMNS